MSSSEEGGKEALQALSLAVNVVTNGLLCALGYVGNVLTIIVLARQGKTYNSNTLLMQVLAGYDMFFLTHTMLYTVLRSVYPATGLLKAYYDISPYIVAFVLPFGWIAQTGTIWFTSALAVDRYIGIAQPFRALTVCTVRNAKKATVVLSITAVLFNLPRFFYYINVALNSRNNATFIAHVRLDLPGFDANIYRYVYHITLTFIFLYVTPLVALSVLNFRLIRALRVANRARKRMSVSARTGSPTKQNLTITFNLVIVISKFILCETPDFISSIVGAVPGAAEKVEYKMFNPIKEMLLVFNSSVNFYIYCMFNAKFRANLRRLLLRCCCCCSSRDGASHTERRLSSSTLNVSLSSLTLAIAAFNRGRTKKTSKTTDHEDCNTQNGQSSRPRYRCDTESSIDGIGEEEEEEEDGEVNRRRLYSAESSDTVLTAVSSDRELSLTPDLLQSHNADFLKFKPKCLNTHFSFSPGSIDRYGGTRSRIYSLECSVGKTPVQMGVDVHKQSLNPDFLLYKPNGCYHNSNALSDSLPTQQPAKNTSDRKDKRSDSNSKSKASASSRDQLKENLHTRSENPDYRIFQPSYPAVTEEGSTRKKYWSSIVPAAVSQNDRESSAQYQQNDTHVRYV